MKYLIFGAGEWGQTVQSYIENSSEDVLVGFIDNNKSGNEINGYGLYKADDISKLEFDKIIISVSKKSALNDIREQLNYLNIPNNKIIGLSEEKALFIDVFAQRPNIYDEIADCRVGWLRSFAKFVKEEEMVGNVAECGVYAGDFAVYINKYFADRKLYLFDTFEGFSDVDLKVERELNHKAFISGEFNQELNFSVNNEEIARRKMPNIEQCEFHKGYFPESAKGIEDNFCFVNLDMDLYQPMLAGLEFFMHKMSNGGVILLHDYFHPELPGVKQAVKDYELKHGLTLSKIPIGDGCSIAIVKV